jgi:integrase
MRKAADQRDERTESRHDWSGVMTGLRQGEIIALKWRDAELVAATLTVRRSS